MQENFNKKEHLTKQQQQQQKSTVMKITIVVAVIIWCKSSQTWDKLLIWLQQEVKTLGLVINWR